MRKIYLINGIKPDPAPKARLGQKSADHIYRLGGEKNQFCKPEALAQAVISNPFRVF